VRRSSIRQVLRIKAVQQTKPFMKRKFFMTFLLFALCSVMTYAQQEITMDSILRTIREDSTIIAKEKPSSTPSRRIRVNGYRVQVYYGGNNQKAKQEARKMAERVKIWFEELPVYTSFSSPHWICRVGDFQTREEAMEVLQAMRESGRFPRAIIVKSKINITEDELRREEPDSCARRDTTAYCTYSGTIG
jgi:hypothetical protein